MLTALHHPAIPYRLTGRGRGRAAPACCPTIELLEDRLLLSGDMVLHWNDILQNTIRTSPPLAVRTARVGAMVHAAIYEAVNAIDHTHRPYLVDIPAPPWASMEAAAAVAGHDTLVRLYPAQQEMLDQLLAESLEPIADGPAKRWGVRVGTAAAQVVLAVREHDGADAVVPYDPEIVPGIWRPTPPGFAPPVGTQWPFVVPFVLASGSQFRPGPPPELTSAAYTAAFNEVKEIGARDSTTRTEEQTEIARFWEYGAGTATAYGHWNQITRRVAEDRGTGLVENARLFALVNFGLMDGSITSWDAKYAYNFWRPITAIREADTDDNPDTEADPEWTPLLTTPAHPAYTSGHSAYGAAAAAVLANYFGDEVSLTITSESIPGVERSFASFSAAATENAQSRLYAGIHWSIDNEVGLAQGWAVGDYVFAHALLPRGGSPRPGGRPGGDARLPERGEVTAVRLLVGPATAPPVGDDAVAVTGPWLPLPAVARIAEVGPTTRPADAAPAIGDDSPVPRGSASVLADLLVSMAVTWSERFPAPL